MTRIDSALLDPREPAVDLVEGRHAKRPALELAILGGEERPWSRSLEQGRYVVGSDRQCDIVIDADGVQPRHFLLVVGSNRAIVRTYGEAVLLNKHLTNESSLGLGDRLWMGGVRIEVTAVGWEGKLGEAESSRAGQTVANRDASLPELISPADEAVLVALDAERTREESEKQSKDGEARVAEVKRRERRLQEVADLLQECLRDVLKKERNVGHRAVALEAHLAAAALVEEKQSAERSELARATAVVEADREQLAEARAEAERLLNEAEAQRREMNRREASLEERRQAVEEREEQLCRREAEVENRFRMHESTRRRLTEEQEQLAFDRVTLGSEKASLVGEYEAIEARRLEMESLRSSLEAQREAFQRAFEADYVAIEETRAVFTERTKELKRAEVDFAWRELALIDREESVSELEAVLYKREQEQARTNIDNEPKESSNSTPSNEAAMSCQINDVELPTFEDLVPVEGLADGDKVSSSSISTLLGVQKVETTAHVMERLSKVEQMLESLLRRLPTEPVPDPDGAVANVKDWRLAFKSPSVEEPRPAVIELEDAANSSSVSRYMEQLLIRMRASNPVVPPPAVQEEEREEVAAGSGDVEPPANPADSVVVAESDVVPTVGLEPIKPSRMKLTKEEQRAQNSSLREVANLSARQAITQHSMRRYKAELTAKAIVSIVAFAIAVFFLTASVQSGNGYLWETVAAFSVVGVIVVDFIVTLRRFPDTTPRVSSAVVQESPAAAGEDGNTVSADEENAADLVAEPDALPLESPATA